MTPDTASLSIPQSRTRILAELAAASDAPPVLVAVSKRQADDRIDACLAAGQRVFGENRVQEAEGRWQPRRGDYSDLQLRLIGPLQSNKASDAAALFDVIETLDRPKLARAMAAAIKDMARAPSFLIQVNTGAEPQKSGVLVEALDDLLALARGECGLNVTGLMCIPPVDAPAGPHFALLAKLAKDRGLPDLSMGMSGDYEMAARFGATHVRIGSALFGERDA